MGKASDREDRSDQLVGGMQVHGPDGWEDRDVLLDTGAYTVSLIRTQDVRLLGLYGIHLPSSRVVVLASL